MNVSSPATGNITASDTFECNAPHTVNFSTNASGAVAYNWNFGDGGTSNLPNPSHTYTSTGSFTVTLQLTNASGCVNTITAPNLIDIGVLNASFTLDSPQGCTPHVVKFTNTSTAAEPIVSYLWLFGDGGTSTQPNPQYTYLNAGTYVPRLIIQTASGCKDTFDYNGSIIVGQSLVPNFTATPLVQCVNLPINFTHNVSGTTSQTIFFWEFGDGQTSNLPNPTHQYSDTGTYSISLTVINQGCATDTERVDYIIIVVPKADFNFEFDCTNPTTVTFRDTSQGADTWFWDFGDGTTSTQQHPVHTFPTQSSYTVTLVVTNFTTGCVDSIKKTLPIGTPNALFFADTLVGCRPLTVKFTDSSTFASSWLWNFGTGATSSVQNPTYTYTDTGLYTVRLIINPGQACSDTLVRTQYIRVNGVIADFTRNPIIGCAPFQVQFTNTSTSFMGSVVSWKYKFGTGDSATVPNPTYTFTQVGNFAVTLTVTDNNGCSASISKQSVSQDYIPDFTSDTVVCPGEAVSFTNTSFPTTGLTYQWYFGDGGTSTQKNPTYTYINAGTYTVMLIIKSSNAGCIDTIIKPNYINVDTPVADFYANSIFASCPPFPVKFFNTTNRTDLLWVWYFGDGDTSTDYNPLHVYKFPGEYDVAMVAYDSSGCRDSIIKLKYIKVGGPLGNFLATPDTGCVPLTVTYSGTYSSNTIDIKADVGTGQVFEDTVNIVYTYTQPGKYYPVFTLTDSLGCVVAYPVDTIVVGLIPYPNLPTDTAICKGNYVQFYLPLGDYFLWEADQNPKYLTCDTCRNPLSTAPDTITYYVTVTTSIGCVARDTITVNVDPLPPIFPGIFYRICPGDTLQLSAGQGVLAATWTPGLYMDDSLSVNPKVFPPDTMIYRVTGSNSTGCSISRIVRVYVIDKVVADLNISDTLVCEGGPVQLDLRVREASYNDTSFLWSPAQYLSSTIIEDPVVNAPFGNYTYTVIVSSSTCTPDTESVNITVAPLPNLEAGDDQVVTPGTQVQIYAASPDQVTYTWTAIDPLSCTNCRRPYITVNQNQTAYVVATNQWGCQTLDSVVLKVVECSPTMVFVPNTFTPNGDGLNDVLYVRGIGLRKLDYLRIYDRWGKLVFETDAINNGWDGTINGKPADIAVYAYTAKGECTNGSSVEVQGNVTLIR
ncbi:MAG: PKD domain-containing protein [Chitinophagales bacterium]|nr:PKD domain-containing protein [Chitinophagales bacterium]